MKQSSFVLVLLVAVGCGPSAVPEAERVTQQTAEIIGGTPAPGDPAVVSLSVSYGAGNYESLCTGTLIAPRTVLTAAHCIYAYGTSVQYFVTMGSNSSAPTRAVLVAQQYKDPSYDQATNDFGLLRLATPIADVVPIPLNETPMTASLIGQPIRHVGFGLTVANSQQAGTKRQVTYNLRQITPFTIESGAQGKQTCQGDSGGPGFMTLPGTNLEKLVGVVSYGDQNCAVEGFDGRVDRGAPWIRQTMAGWETPTCSTDGACVQGCTPIDQDCACAADGVCAPECIDASMDADCPKDCGNNGVCAIATCGHPDFDCVAEGFRCDAVTQCKDRLCVSDPQNTATYCSKFCSTSSDCPSTMECVQASCQLKQRPVRQISDSCFPSSDYCAQGICTGPSGGISRCVLSCLTANNCPSGSVCEAGSDSRRYCRPAALSFNPITLPAVTSVEGPPAGCSSSGGLLGLWLGVTLLRRRRAGS